MIFNNLQLLRNLCLLNSWLFLICIILQLMKIISIHSSFWGLSYKILILEALIGMIIAEATIWKSGLIKSTLKILMKILEHLFHLFVRARTRRVNTSLLSCWWGSLLVVVWISILLGIVWGCCEHLVERLLGVTSNILSMGI